MKGLLKWPLIVTAVAVALRVVLEQGGAPDAVANLVSVAFLTVLACPVYFAVSIARSGEPRPYMTHLKAVFLFAVLARAIVLPTYWLARIYGWPQARFYGLAGPDVTPFTGFIAVPLLTAGFWIVASTVVGGAVGAIIIAVMRRRSVGAAYQGVNELK